MPRRPRLALTESGQPLLAGKAGVLFDLSGAGAPVGLDVCVTDLEGRGVVFEGPVSDQGWGRLVTIRLPGGGKLGLYEARHPTADGLEVGWYQA